MKKLLFGFLLLPLAMLSACHNHEEHGDEHDGNAAAAAAEHHDEIVLHKEKADAAGVVCQAVKAGGLKTAFQTSGSLLQDIGGKTAITAPVSGQLYYQKNIVEGSKVNKNESLFCISAARLQDGDPAALARIEYEKTLENYNLAKKQAQDKLISQAELNEARAIYQNAKAAYEALGHNSNGTIVKAPQSGNICSLGVASGSYVEKGQTIAFVSTSDKLLLQAEVPTRHFGSISKIKGAKFKPSTSDKIYDTADMGGKIVAYGHDIDPGAAYIPVTIQIDNSENLLPGCFAEIWLYTDENSNAISVPVSALVEEQGSYSVFARLDENCYRKIPVEIGGTDGSYTEITKGLQTGDTIVTSGTIHIRLANATTIPGHNHNH